MTTSPEPAEYRQARFRAPHGATTLLLIRHGESEPARDGVSFPLVDGHGDPGLAPEGRQQAERVADRLGGEDFAAIYVSTLRRTAQTAAPLADRLGRAPAVEPDLREVYLGEWEGGVLRKRFLEQHPTARMVLAEQRWDVIPGAEPAPEFEARVRAAAERLARAHAGGRLAVFTHGGVIGRLLATASGSRPFAFTGADNGSISELVVAGESWIVRRFNDTAHLAGGDGPQPGSTA